MRTRRTFLAGAGAIVLAAKPAAAQMGLLLSPKTLVDRALEARSMKDIAIDNEVDVKVNAAMAEAGTVKASTEIYEQRLLITGLIEDKATYDKLYSGVRGISGIRKLYWHVLYATPAEQKKKGLISWEQALLMEEKAKARLIGTMDVHDINYRVAVDTTATIFVLGRAKSEPEHQAALARLRDGDGVKRVVDYIEVRP